MPESRIERSWSRLPWSWGSDGAPTWTSSHVCVREPSQKKIPQELRGRTRRGCQWQRQVLLSLKTFFNEIKIEEWKKENIRSSSYVLYLADTGSLHIFTRLWTAREIQVQGAADPQWKVFCYRAYARAISPPPIVLYYAHKYFFATVYDVLCLEIPHVGAASKAFDGVGHFPQGPLNQLGSTHAPESSLNSRAGNFCRAYWWEGD